jgi:endogenous inhibitor of DNA gyrase (YacG/DUF329 family)
MAQYQCKLCGKAYQAKPSEGRKYCSVKCSRVDPEWRQKQREIKLRNPSRYWLGKNHDLLTRRKISFSLMGNTPWNKGKQTGNNGAGFKPGNPGYWLGKKRSPWDIEKFRISHLGKTLPMELRLKRSGPNASNWRGGISPNPWGPEFNRELKNSIRHRDDETCQLCGENSGYSHGRRHSVHHINYDKNNNSPKNLITPCCNCHMKTGFSRDKWQFLFETYQELRGISI